MRTNVSRNILTEAIRLTDPVTGNAVQPDFLDIRQRVTAFDRDDRYVSVDSSMNWGTLARQRLGDARHWWVIADLSGVIDPFTEMQPGDQLRVPSVQRLLFSILTPKQSGL